ncbi:MAG: hypothetical protein GTN74_06895 [Proteobacteria bacterium]|nr:hypothetical protein [Pseudomonadota bacterium]NIS69324.1 hypothetical protein [Pseudomonadota bacterium]
MKFLKTALLFLLLFATLSVHEGATAKMEQDKPDLPKTVGVWTRPDSPRVVDGTTIFKYMNGAGELYLGYRFDHLEVYEYAADGQDNILVELYFMKTSDDAFGLLSQDWGGEPVTLSQSPLSKAKLTPASSVSALYGKGLLRVWSDDIYARVMAYRETPESKEAVLSLGRAMTANRKNSSPPRLLNILPDTIDSAWRLRRDRISYFRSFLVLNSLYYLSHQNILGLDLSTEAVTAPYERVTSTENRERVQLLVVKYRDPARARHALEQFQEAYLPEHKKDFVSGSMAENPNFFKIEDGWLGYKLYDKRIALVFECPDQGSARMIINQIQFVQKGE